MAKSFFHFLMSFRHPKPVNHINQFANDAYHDHSFPKNSMDYEELSTYLELSGFYLKSMTVFDEAWEIYKINEKKAYR